MPTAEQLARLLAIREAAASVALDGETMHVAAPDGSCCLDHARERIAELEGQLHGLEAELLDVADLRDASRLLRTVRHIEGEVYWYEQCTYDVSDTNDPCDCGWPAVAEYRFDDGYVWPLCATHLKKVLEATNDDATE